jgi:hypothetical protein
MVTLNLGLTFMYQMLLCTRIIMTDTNSIRSTRGHADNLHCVAVFLLLNQSCITHTCNALALVLFIALLKLPDKSIVEVPKELNITRPYLPVRLPTPKKTMSTSLPKFIKSTIQNHLYQNAKTFEDIFCIKVLNDFDDSTGRGSS